MFFFNRKKKTPVPRHISWKITQECLNLILECAQSNHPQEFGGMLRVEPDDKHTIAEVVILPGTISGDSHAIFQMHMKPIDFSIVGTVHSHPSYNPNPSPADQMLFSKYGKVHMTVAYPYTSSSWKAFDFSGEEIDMVIVH